MKRFNLKGMSFEDLVALRDSAEAAISKRVAEERQSLEDRLARLSGFSGRTTHKDAGSPLKGRKAVPKFRNPENPDETWAGRGMKPRWVQALLDQGRNLEEFAVEGAEATAKPAAKRGRPPKGSVGRKPVRKSTRKKAAA